ncbi:MAG: DUF1499 domain-containing protein, partial [Rhizobiaceae bacterium]|nr:DUF1499 domain-containing protein [Rhizobiaceae bacterium]
MIAHFEPSTSFFAIASRRVAVFAAVLALTALAAHRYGFLETVAFIAVLAVVLALVGAALALWIVGFRGVWYRGDRGAGSLVVGALVLALVLAPYGVAGFRAATAPALTDISTDLDDPPPMPIAESRRVLPMNLLVPPNASDRAAQAQAYPEVTGHRYSMPTERVLVSVRALVSARGWRLVNPVPDTDDGGDSLIEATATTPFLSLPVDIAIRIADEDSSTYVDMRSASRYGPHD